jgi:hypothetical protein
MSVGLVSRENIDPPWSHVAAVRDSDVHVNALSVDALFALYEGTGFLYPAKAARLAPHVDLVRDNWRRLLQAGDSLLYVLTAGADADGGLASIAVWRTTRQGWVWQHHVSAGNPLRSRTVMLGGLTRCTRLGIGESQQNWFRPENRFPSRVFGSMVQSVGEASSSVRRHMFLAVPRRPMPHGVHGLRIVAYDRSHHDALCALATRARGRVYVTAEELDRDVQLQSIDCLYREVGLRRTRHVWLAYGRRSDLPVGAAVAYRGPLGLNFSFLENRCDLLFAPGLSGPDVAHVSAALMNASLAAYADFELDEIPVVADQEAMPALRTLGAQFLRNYCHGIWLKAGHPMLSRHVDHFYARLLKRAERRSAPPALTA